MSEVTLNCDMPFLYKGNWTFYKPGQKLRVVETKTMFYSKECQLGIKVAYGDFAPFEGYVRADAFVEYEKVEVEKQ